MTQTISGSNRPTAGPVSPPTRAGAGRRHRVWTPAGYGIALLGAATVVMVASPRSSWWWIYGMGCQLVGWVAVVVAVVRWRRGRFVVKVHAIALGTARIPERSTPAKAAQAPKAKVPAARSATPVTSSGTGGLEGMRVTQLRVIRSEWTKFHSLRSSKIVLIVMALVVLGIAMVVAGVISAHWDKLTPDGRKQFNPALSPLAGVGFSGLAVGVLGVLMIAGEYATGMIRSSLTAVPRRLQFLIGKVVVLVGVVGFAALATTLSAFFVAQAMLTRQHLNVTLAAPHATYFVFAAAAYLVLVAVMGMALGTVLRHTVAAISALFAMFLIMPIVVGFLPGALSLRIGPLLPAAAGQAFWTHAASPTGVLGSPWPGLATLLGWVGGLFTIGAMRMLNEDV